MNPLQVRIAETHTERENKLFIGMLPKTIHEQDLHAMFAPFGELREVHIIRGPEGSPKGCAFVKFVGRESAFAAIEAMNDTIPMVRMLKHYVHKPCCPYFDIITTVFPGSNSSTGGQIRGHEKVEAEARWNDAGHGLTSNDAKFSQSVLDATASKLLKMVKIHLLWIVTNRYT